MEVSYYSDIRITGSVVYSNTFWFWTYFWSYLPEPLKFLYSDNINHEKFIYFVICLFFFFFLKWWKRSLLKESTLQRVGSGWSTKASGLRGCGSKAQRPAICFYYKMDLSSDHKIKHNQVTGIYCSFTSILSKFRLVKLQYTILSTLRRKGAVTEVEGEKV